MSTFQTFFSPAVSLNLQTLTSARPENAYGAQLQIFMVRKDLITAEKLKLTVGAGMVTFITAVINL